MKNVKFFLLLLFCQGASATPSLEAERTLGTAPELGLTLQYLVPNHLPDFEVPVTAFGIHIGIPVFSQTIQLQAVYGGGDKISLYNIEAAFRLNIPTPFFTSFVFAGGHYIHWGYARRDQSFFGPLTGLGFYFPMARNFKMGLGMKIYLPQKTILEFGGGFAFLI